MTLDEVLISIFENGRRAGWKAREDLRLGMVGAKEKEVTAVILEVIERWYGITMEMMLVRSRKRPLVFCRQLTMFFMWYFTDVSLVEIGKMFGLDHTSVVHGRDTIEGFLDVPGDLSEEISSVVDEVREGILTRNPKYRQPARGLNLVRA